MFGHDNQDDEDDKKHDGGQISLPPAGDFGQDGQDNGDDSASLMQDAPQTVQPTGTGNPDSAQAGHRKTAKSGAPTDELLDIKQDALQALTPLVNHLDQTPEEKFRTTMMMIQASDNHSLIKLAYEAAQQIADEKERAQALLDIVNEINYFTQHSQAA